MRHRILVAAKTTRKKINQRAISLGVTIADRTPFPRSSLQHLAVARPPGSIRKTRLTTHSSSQARHLSFRHIRRALRTRRERQPIFQLNYDAGGWFPSPFLFLKVPNDAQVLHEFGNVIPTGQKVEITVEVDLQKFLVLPQPPRFRVSTLPKSHILVTPAFLI